MTTNQSASTDDRKRILEAARVIAVVGLSANAWRPSYGVAEYLQAAGYEVIPVNPTYVDREILGLRVYASLAEVPTPIDIVDVFRRAEFTPEVARQAVAVGAKTLWLQLGIVNQEAARIARAGGLAVVMDRCIAVEHGRLISA